MGKGVVAVAIPGYGVPFVFNTLQPTTVPSLAYAYITGGGGRMRSSPDAVVCANVSLPVRSSVRPTSTVSFISLSRGTVGVEVSSNIRLHHDSLFGVEESYKHPINPISDDVLSPTKSKNLAGSQLRKRAMNAPGKRKPGNGKYGVVSFTSVAVFVFASKESNKCDCSVSGVNGPGAIYMEWKSGFASHVVERMGCEGSDEGLGIQVLILDVSVGLKVTMSPLCKPIAICLPFGDHETSMKTLVHYVQAAYVSDTYALLEWSLVFHLM